MLRKFGGARLAIRLEPLEVIPHRFVYCYECPEPDCPGHRQGIIDWEIHQAYRKWRHDAVAAGHDEADVPLVGSIAGEQVRLRRAGHLFADERQAERRGACDPLGDVGEPCVGWLASSPSTRHLDRGSKCEYTPLDRRPDPVPNAREVLHSTCTTEVGDESARRSCRVG